MRDNYIPISWQFFMALWRTKSDIPMYPHFFAKKCQQLAAQGSQQFKKMLPGRLGHVAVATAKWQFQSIDGLHKSWGIINPSNSQGCDTFPTFYQPFKKGAPKWQRNCFYQAAPKWIYVDEWLNINQCNCISEGPTVECIFMYILYIIIKLYGWIAFHQPESSEIFGCFLVLQTGPP